MKKGDQTEAGKTVAIPIDGERNVFFVGNTISVRAGNGARFRFNELIGGKKTDTFNVDIELLKGRIWVTRTDNNDTVKIITPKGYLILSGSANVEIRLTGSDSVEVLCWSGDAAFYPSKDSKDSVGIGPRRQTVVTSSGSIATPHDINPEDINLWQAWNLLTDINRVVSNKVPDYKKAFVEWRIKNKVTGDLPQKIVLSSRTLVSGGRQTSDWQKAGISEDGKVVISYREDGMSQDEKGKLNLRLTFRNDGMEKSQPLAIAIEALDVNGKVSGRKETKIPALLPLNETRLEASIPTGADIMSYNIRILFP
jgi:hypothetical protein